jgi:PIN domain nuclease of toxin-antitoxin system
VLALGVTEVPLTGDIGIDAVDLDGFRNDPADRIIMATARKLRATLVTADEPILRWAGDLDRLDARR